MTPSNLTLRPVTPADFPILYEHQLDPLATQMADFPSRGYEDFMAHWEKITHDDSVLIRAALLDGLLTGSVCSFVMEGKREVGYWFGREFWGQGLATRALAAFLLEETRRPLHGFTATGNIGSRRVLEKCGFVLEAELADGFVFTLES